MKFKVGDTVKRVKCNYTSYKGMKVGDIDTIVGIWFEGTDLQELCLKRFGEGHSSKYFELAKPKEKTHLPEFL